MTSELKLAALTESMLDGKITYWMKKSGEKIKTGEPIYEVETDKANVEVQSPVSGVIIKILVQEGDTAGVGDVLAIVDEQEEERQPVIEHILDDTPEAVKIEKVGKPPILQVSNKPISPVARRIAKEQNINLDEIQGTGPKGLVTGDDVRIYITHLQKTSEEITTQSTKFGQEELIPLDGIRKAIADKVTTSRREIPDVTTFNEVDMTELLKLKEQYDFSITSFIVMAAIGAIKEFPFMNSSLVNNQIHVKKYINIGVAASSHEGLTVPVVHNIEGMTIIEIGEKIIELSEKAKANKLSLDDITGGTFTITNSGVFGSLFFTPIINFPESAILGVGNIIKRPAVVDDQIQIRSMMYLAVSYDHRIIDGATAVQFLKRIKERLEEPQELLQQN